MALANFPPRFFLDFLDKDKMMIRRVFAIMCLMLFSISCDFEWSKCFNRKCSEKCTDKGYLGGSAPTYYMKAKIVECLCYPSVGSTKIIRYPHSEIGCRKTEWQ